jgi:dTDP-glucose 4,6-dehydratase
LGLSPAASEADLKNILVTGGAGFIGSNFVRYLLEVEPNFHLFILDALTYAGNLENLKNLPDPKRHTFIQGDICDRAPVEDLLRRHQIDTVVHFAAESHVDRSILGPAPFIQTNIVGTFTLLDAARQVWLREGNAPAEGPRFHHISTDEVYGSLGPGDPPFSEVTPYAPNSPYAATKAASDQLVRAYGHTYGLPFTLTNCSNNYGPYQFPEKLIPLMILNALQGKPLPVYGDGMQVRDWLYVVDHCEAIHLVLRKGRLGETYNIGGNNQHANLEIVQDICALLDELVPDSAHRPHAKLIQMVADRPGHDRRYAMDIRKIQNELGWKPRHDTANGLRDTVKWYLAHRDWVETIPSRGEYNQWVDHNYVKRGMKE